MFLALGYACRDFTLIGIGFWGIDYCEEYYGTSPTIASLSFAAKSLVGGIIAIYSGGYVISRLLRPYEQQRTDGKITEEKLTWYKAEFASRICFWCIFICIFFFILAGLSPVFIMFIIFLTFGLISM